MLDTGPQLRAELVQRQAAVGTMAHAHALLAAATAIGLSAPGPGRHERVAGCRRHSHHNLSPAATLQRRMATVPLGVRSQKPLRNRTVLGEGGSPLPTTAPLPLLVIAPEENPTYLEVKLIRIGIWSIVRSAKCVGSSCRSP
jgi:hypothetical protein